jgi:hypothetical protein
MEEAVEAVVSVNTVVGEEVQRSLRSDQVRAQE